jgi:DNA anti-recombination protein RmuC
MLLATGAASPAFAAPAETSFPQVSLETITAAVKNEAERIATAAQESAEHTRRTLSAFKAQVRTKIEDLQAQAETLNRDAAAELQTWKATFLRSMTELRASVADTLERIAAWMRPEPPQSVTPTRNEVGA